MNPRILEDPESAKGNILRAAARLFREKGFGRTTVRDIAAEVGILSGSLFHHFPNKEAILVQLMEELILLVEDEMQRRQNRAAGPWDSLRALVLCELQAIHAEIGTGFSVLMTEWRSLNDANQQYILALRNRYESRWLECLTLLQARGDLRVEPFLARQFIRGAIMETWHWYRPGGAMALTDIADQLLLLAGRSTG